MQMRRNHQARFSGVGAGKVPETARSPQNGSEAFSAVRARDVMVNIVYVD